MMPKGPTEFRHSVVGNITLLDDPEKSVGEYFEQYDGYFSNGWKTDLDAASAFSALEQLGLVKSMGEFEVSDDRNGGWILDAEAGSIYWAIDQSGVSIAGVLAPDDINTEILSQWHTATVSNFLETDNCSTTGYVS